MKRKSSRITTILLVLIFLAGLSLLLYPTVSDYWNSLHQSRAIASYSEQVADLDEEHYSHLWKDAQRYNETLLQRDNIYILNEEQRAAYDTLLDPSGTGVMGYIEIPAIACSLPIYHGADEAVLQVAVGHLDWTSLPTGGAGTHCVISGHRGLPSAKLFTNLDQLAVGDVFLLRVLNEVLTYEVDQILIVLPTETDALQVVPGEDYCTLVTCTPYGINSHRLLVRGHRIETEESAAIVHVVADAIQIAPTIVAPIVAIPILLLFLLVLFIRPKRRR